LLSYSVRAHALEYLFNVRVSQKIGLIDGLIVLSRLLKALAEEVALEAGLDLDDLAHEQVHRRAHLRALLPYLLEQAEGEVGELLS